MKADSLGVRPSIAAASHLQGRALSLPSRGCRPPEADTPPGISLGCQAAHLCLRHPLGWTALQQDLMLQRDLLAQWLLVEVLPQVWGRGRKTQGLPAC